MSEQFHSEKPQENSPVTEKAFPPALEEFKTLMGRSVLRTLVPVYEGLSDTKKIALLRSLGENKEKMGQFTQDPTGMRALVEDIVGRLERQEVKKDNQEVKVDIGEKEKDNTEKVEKNKERLKKAREQLTATYALFGGKDGFESKFPKHEEWKQEATARVQREAKKTGKELTPDELATRVETSMIVSHGAEIKASLASDPAKQKEFASHMGELRASAEALSIPYETSFPKEPVSVATEKEITPALLGFKPGDSLTRTGSEFRHGDQTIDISNPPPRKFIEGDNGTHSESDIQPYKPPHENLEKQANCLKSLQEVIPNFDGDMNHAEQFVKTSDALIETKTRELSEKKATLTEYRKDMSPKDIADTENKIRTGEEDLQKKKESLEKFKATLREFVRLKQEESRSVPDYQKQVAEKDDIARGNLQFFFTKGLSALGQPKIDQITSIINGRRQLHGEERIDLKKALTEKDKSEYLKALQTISGEAGKGLFRTDENGTVSIVEDGNARDRIIGGLRQAGLIDQLTDSDTGVIIEGRMKEGFEEKKDEEESAE